MSDEINSLPIINISALIAGLSEKRIVAEEIGNACRDYGFFYITGHGIDETLQQRLEDLSKEFFKKPLEEKQKTKKADGVLAMRGYYPVGSDFTSGKPDLKEGLYFGRELEDPLVGENTPNYSKNIFPEIPNFRETVVEYSAAMIELGQKLMDAIALSLGLEENYFHGYYSKDPSIGFRIFNYPKEFGAENTLGIQEHTDYGFLTILKQDHCGGLQVKHKSNWIEAQPIDGSFVCNIGDMLDRMTGGHYKSTPHRVKSPLLSDRLSFPSFFSPNINLKADPIESVVSKHGISEDKETRWDGLSVHQFNGTFGEYLAMKRNNANRWPQPVK